MQDLKLLTSYNYLQTVSKHEKRFCNIYLPLGQKCQQSPFNRITETNKTAFASSTKQLASCFE